MSVIRNLTFYVAQKNYWNKSKSMKSRFVVLVCFLFSFAPMVYANDDTQFWSAIALKGPINDNKLLFWFDGHARFSDDASRLGVSIVRPGIGWQTTKDLSLWLGIARVTVNNFSRAVVEEDRIWQQALYKVGQFAGGTIKGRSRFEQRFRDDTDTGLRWRQTFSWSKPISGTIASYVISNELFINLNDTEFQSETFDQNRAYFGFSFKISNQSKVGLGYLNNIINVENGSDITNHVVSASYSFSW